jgi:hypothetical protein
MVFFLLFPLKSETRLAAALPRHCAPHHNVEQPVARHRAPRLRTWGRANQLPTERHHTDAGSVRQGYLAIHDRGAVERSFLMTLRYQVGPVDERDAAPPRRRHDVSVMHPASPSSRARASVIILCASRMPVHHQFAIDIIDAPLPDIGQTLDASSPMMGGLSRSRRCHRSVPWHRLLHEHDVLRGHSHRAPACPSIPGSVDADRLS